MPHLPEDRLALVRKLYETSELTIAEIAILAEVSESAIYQRARREQWATTRRPGVNPRRVKRRPPLPPTPALAALAGQPEAGPPEVESSQTAPSLMAPEVPQAPGQDSASQDSARQDSGGRDSGGQDIDRAATARRLWRAIDRHLEGLEADEAPETEIRAAQNLSTLARTLETLVGLERGLVEEQQAARPGGPYPDEGPEDIDEFRYEIARRLENLVAEERAKENTVLSDGGFI